jgi:hypothetical protein
MKTKLMLAAALAVLPSLAGAGPGCMGEERKTTASACPDGTAWDSATQTCAPKPTS